MEATRFNCTFVPETFRNIEVDISLEYTYYDT
jgi:hypothetical protein